MATTNTAAATAKPTIKDLTPSQCILLTVHYASEGNIKALHSFTPLRADVLDPTLVLRILLSYLPESLEPREYTGYVEEVASRLYLDISREEIEVDTAPVAELRESEAKKKVKKLDLKEIHPPQFPPHAPDDLLTLFLCHRAQRIDTETGLVNLVPRLVEPFVQRNDYLRIWYISTVLPIIRLNWEYYPDHPTHISLLDFSNLEGKRGIDVLLQRTSEVHGETEGRAGRDMKGLVGPWMYGHSDRKRRKLNSKSSSADGQEEEGQLTSGMRKIALNGISADDTTGHDWEYAYRWMVHQSSTNFPLITSLIEDWDGPSDVDTGGFEQGHRPYLDDDIQRKLELQYAQAAFAACYATTSPSETTVRGAHGVLARLAELLDFVPPPDLATSVDSLPLIEQHSTVLDQSQNLRDLDPDRLLTPEHPLTTPRMETYMLLQMLVYSAYQLLGLDYPVSLVSVARIVFYGTAESQLAVLTKILKGLGGKKRSEAEWTSDRAKLLWLWNWGIDGEDSGAKFGAGVLGKIEKEDFEGEMLGVFTEGSCYPMITKLYLQKTPQQRTLPLEQTESILLSKALEAYDGASNGNRTRGGMRKAHEIISTFRPHFAESVRFRRVAALISATHALSFYSLTLQHGVPFQPVSIRVSQDPIALLSKVLEQNARSYTKLDDLVDIAQNFVAAGLPTTEEDDGGLPTDAAELAKKRKDAERRVTFMAVEAALREDDFETAYSYIVNRLTPSSPTAMTPPKATHIRNSSAASTPPANEDDISWRAAFLAGRFRPTSSTPPTLRRLDQRTELLSLALLLAPVSALTEILSAWRRCEEEASALLASQQRAEEEFDDRADKRQPLPGNFDVVGEQPAMVLGQKSRVMTGRGGGEAEGAPVSMFDLTRSAAAAFSRGIGGGVSRSESRLSGESARGVELGGGGGVEGDERVRKRDVVANAVSGGIASGLGWVLGATPADRGER